ncbi:unnamed protein product [Meganyctiphanes norvegica]|uniref:Putative zinc-finger domain-containing protein n=1 Tax=Meganyctiphanes norvegica TaxID=48144 RepID=A0AAV2RUR9_MEGNR
MEVDAENEFWEIVSGPEEGEISEEDEECEDNTQLTSDVTGYTRKDKCSTTVIYDDRGRTTIVGGSEKNNAWPVSSYSTSDRTKHREKEDDIIIVKKVVAKKSSEKHPKKIRHHSKKRGRHRKHKSRSQEVSKSSSKTRHNVKKSRKSRSVSVSSCTSLSSNTSGSNSDIESSSCSCSLSRSPSPNRKRSKSRSPDNNKMRGKENKHGSLTEKKLLNRLRPYSPPKPEPEEKRSYKSSQSYSTVKRSLPKKGSSRGTHRRSPLSYNEVQTNSSGSSSKSKLTGSSRNGKIGSISSIVRKNRPTNISNSKTTNSSKRNSSKDISKSRNDHSSKPRRKIIEPTTNSNITVENISLPGGAAPTPGSIGEMLLKKQMKGVLRKPAPEKDDLKDCVENSLVLSTGSSAENGNTIEASVLQNKSTDDGSNQDVLGQDEDEILQLRLVALKSSLKVLSQVRREGRDVTISSQIHSEIDQVQQSVIKENTCEETTENSSVIDDVKKELPNCQSPQCEIIEEVYNVDASPLDVLFETALGLSPTNSPDSKWPLVNLENSSQNAQLNLEVSNGTGNTDILAISTRKSYLDDVKDDKGKCQNQIEEILLEPEDQNQDPVDMDICDSSPEDNDILDEEVILEEVGEDISIISNNRVVLNSNSCPQEISDGLGSDKKDQTNFQIPVEWAYMMPPPPPADQPENDISNFNNWCYDQNMYLQTMQQSSYDSQQVPYDSSNQTQYPNYQKAQMDPSMTTTWQQNISHWNNHYDNTYGNVTDNLLNIPKATNDLPDDLLNVSNAKLAHSEASDDTHDQKKIHTDNQSSDSKELKDTAAQYYQAFMSAIYTRQNSDSNSDTLNTDKTMEEEISMHFSPSQMEQQIDALLAMSRSKKNTLITVVQSQSTRGERKRRRRARMREKLQAKKAEKKALKQQEPTNKVLNTSVETNTPQSTSSPVVSSPNVTDDDNEDLDLLRAQLLIDLHKKRNKQEQLQENSTKSVTSGPVKAGPSMSSDTSNIKSRAIVKRTVVKKLRGAQRTDTSEHSKVLSKNRNASFKLHDIGGFSLDPKSTRFDFPIPKDMPKFKFPPVKPVIISLNPDDDTTDEEDNNENNFPSTSSLPSRSSSPSTSKESLISIGNPASAVSGQSIDDLLKSFRNVGPPQVNQNKKIMAAQGKTKAPCKESLTPATPNIVRHLSRTQQLEYLQLKEQIRKKEIQQRKRQQILKQKQKTEANKKFEAIEERVKRMKINSSNKKIIAIEEKIKLAKAFSKDDVSKLIKPNVSNSNRKTLSEEKEYNNYPENADQGNLLFPTQFSTVEHDISAPGNSLESKNVGKSISTVHSCISNKINDKLLQKKIDPPERVSENVTESEFYEKSNVTEGVNNYTMILNKINDTDDINVSNNTVETSSNQDTSLPCSPKISNVSSQNINYMDEDEDVLRLMVLQTINRRNATSTTTVPPKKPESDSINTEKVSQAVIKNEKCVNPNGSPQNVQEEEPSFIKKSDSKVEINIKSNNTIIEDVSEKKDNAINEKSNLLLGVDTKVKLRDECNGSALKTNEKVEESSECALKLDETGQCDEDEDYGSEQDSDLVLPEEWFDVDELEDILLDHGSPTSQKTSKENGSIEHTNSKVMSPLKGNKSNYINENSTPKANVDVMLYSEINSNVDVIKSNCKENVHSLQKDSKETSQSIHENQLLGAIKSDVETTLPIDKSVSTEAMEKDMHIEKICDAESDITCQNTAEKGTENFISPIPNKEKILKYIPIINEQNCTEDIKVCGESKDLNENQKEQIGLKLSENSQKKIKSNNNVAESFDIMKDSVKDCQNHETNEPSFIKSEMNIVKKVVTSDDEKMDISLISNEDNKIAINESNCQNQEINEPSVIKSEINIVKKVVTSITSEINIVKKEATSDDEKIDISLMSNEDNKIAINESNCQNQEINEPSVIKSEINIVKKVGTPDNEKIDISLTSNEDNGITFNESIDSSGKTEDNLNCNFNSKLDQGTEVLTKDSKSLKKCAETRISMPLCNNASDGQISLTKNKIDESKTFNEHSSISISPTSICNITTTTSNTTTITTTTTTSTTSSNFISSATSKNGLQILSAKTTNLHDTPITHSKPITNARTLTQVPLPGMPNKSSSTNKALNKQTVGILNTNKVSCSKTPQKTKPMQKKSLILLRNIEADYKKRRINMSSMISSLHGLVQEATAEERQRQAMRERATALRQELQNLETQFEVSCRQVKQKMSRIKTLQTQVNTERKIVSELERKGQILGQQELGSQYKLSKVLSIPSNIKSDQTKNLQQVNTLNNKQKQPVVAMTTKTSSVVHNVVPNQHKSVSLVTSSSSGKESTLSKSQDNIKKAAVVIPDSLRLYNNQKSVSSEKIANESNDKNIKIVQNINLSKNDTACKTSRINSSNNGSALSFSKDVTQKASSRTGVDDPNNQKNEMEKRNMSEKRKDPPDINFSFKGSKQKTSETLHELNEECKKVSEMDVMCPYDLMGRCNDDSCPYLHLKTDHQKANCGENLTAKNFGKKSVVNCRSNVNKQLSVDATNVKQHTINVEGSHEKDKQIHLEPNVEQNSAKHKSKSNINTVTDEININCEKSNNKDLLQTEGKDKSSCSVESLAQESLHIKDIKNITLETQDSQSDLVLNKNEENPPLKSVFGVIRRRNKSFVKSNVCESINIVAVDDDSAKSSLKLKVVMETDKVESKDCIKKNENINLNIEEDSMFIKDKDNIDSNKFDLINKTEDCLTQNNINIVNENSDTFKPVMELLDIEQDKEERIDRNVFQISDIIGNDSQNDKNLASDSDFGTNESPTLRVSSRKRSCPTNSNTETPRRGRSGTRGRGRGAVRGRSGSSTRSSSSTRSQNNSCSREREASPLPTKVPKIPSKVSKESTKVTRGAGRGRRGKTPQKKGKRKEQ